MNKLLRIFTVIVLSMIFAFIAFSQDKKAQPKNTNISDAGDETLVEIIVPLKNENAYYCLESPDSAIWIPEFREAMNNQLMPLLSKGGGFEFMGNNTVKTLFPRKNKKAVFRFWEEQEATKPEASKEDRKQDSIKRCQ